MKEQNVVDFLQPETTAVIVNEVQEYVLGEGSPLAGLVEAFEARGGFATLPKLLISAREAGVRIFHCTAERRADGLGEAYNTPLMRGLAGQAGGSAPIAPGSPGAQPLSMLGLTEDDIVFSRLHGMTPFHESGLDPLLRHAGIKTVVFTGVSLNVGVYGGVIEAINRGYTAVVPRDCVAGRPAEYGDAILKYGLPSIAYVSDAATIAAAWGVPLS